MHRLTLRLSVALLTFIVGITAASIWILHRNRKMNSEQPASLTSSNPSQVDEVARAADNLTRIFSGFLFVENGAYVPQSIPSHGMEAKSVPTRFEVGQQYIFHSHYSDNDYLFEELQNRIRSQGFEILAAENYAHRYIGGLLFRIKFRNAYHHFLIFNAPDRQILGNMEKYRGWSVDDYVLVIEGNGN